MKSYRPEIDGLRAIAIIPVLLFHAGFKSFSGGFVGVDVFFVISGYLITRIIFNDILENKFSLLEFYERRARRILPNLLFICVVSTLLSWLFLDLTALEDFGKSLIGVVTFSSNFYFWLKQGYFSESTELMPLMHTWSLAVEEQFYLFFPILLILMSKMAKKKIFILLLILLLISLSISIWAVNFKNSSTTIASGAFYLLPTRAWEIGIGALIAILPVNFKNTFENIKPYIFIIEIIGISLILFPIFSYSENTQFPGMASILPVIGTGIIIFSCTKTTLIGKLLSNKIFVFVGLISYSLYLWHQIVFSFWRNTHLNSKLEDVEKLFLILLSFGLSYFSYKFIEKPFRDKNFLNQKQILLYSLISLLVLGILGYFSILASSEKELVLAKKLSNSEYIYFQNFDERKFTQNRIAFEKRKVDVIVMGSSRIMQLGSSSLGKPTLNLSVSGASVEDFIALVPESINKFNPTVCVLGADPWLFNKNSRQTRWNSIEEMYAFWKDKINETNDKTSFLSKRIKERDNNWLKTIYNKVSLSNKLLLPLNDIEENLAKKAKDGLCIYSKDYATQSQTQIIKKFPEILDYSMGNYEFDENALNSYLNLIKFLKRKGVKVILMLSPYHPRLIKLMRLKNSKIISIENEFKKIAEKMNIQIIGSYDPSKISTKLNETDFFDGMHPKNSCMDLIFKNLDLGKIKK